MNYEKLYQYRFSGIDQHSREVVWREVSRFMHKKMGAPKIVLDPAGGRGELIRHIEAREKWVADIVVLPELRQDLSLKILEGSVFDLDFPKNHFEGIFVSNFLEHLPTPTSIYDFLDKMSKSLVKGGKILIMGPNLKYCANEYFDCADHILPLTHISVAEHLAAAGFYITQITPRFLPFSFRSRLPASPHLTRLYLNLPWAWPLFGKQFLVIAEKRD